MRKLIVWLHYRRLRRQLTRKLRVLQDVTLQLERRMELIRELIRLDLEEREKDDE